MYITRVPNRDSPPAVLLRESYREGGKVKNRTLANLSSWPEAKVEALSRALKGLPPAGLEGMVEVARSLPHGHVAAVLGTIRELGLEELIDPVPSRQRDLVTAMIVAAVIDGSSKLDTARGLRAQTAASSLGAVLGLEACGEDDLYQAMDWLLPRQEAIEDTLASRHLAGGTLVLYDVSSAAFGGRTCPLGETGHPRDGGTGPAADCLRGAHQRRGDPGRGAGLQGRHRRPGHPRRPGQEAESAVRPGPRGPGRGPRLPRRAAGRLLQPVPGRRAGPQARRAARCHRSRAGKIAA